MQIRLASQLTLLVAASVTSGYLWRAALEQRSEVARERPSLADLSPRTHGIEHRRVAAPAAPAPARARVHARYRAATHRLAAPSRSRRESGTVASVYEPARTPSRRSAPPAPPSPGAGRGQPAPPATPSPPSQPHAPAPPPPPPPPPPPTPPQPAVPPPKPPPVPPATPPVVSAAPTPTATRPGHGYGDKNHVHTGPPGQTGAGGNPHGK